MLSDEEANLIFGQFTLFFISRKGLLIREWTSDVCAEKRRQPSASISSYVRKKVARILN
jgi:hypothetical protein